MAKKKKAAKNEPQTTDELALEIKQMQTRLGTKRQKNKISEEDAAVMEVDIQKKKTKLANMIQKRC